LESFRATGIEEFVVVTGYERNTLEQHLSAQPGHFNFILNDRYRDTNTIFSLYLAREHLRSDCYYANADVLFDYRLPARLADARAEASLAVRFGSCGAEEVKVAGTRNAVARIGKHLDPKQCLGEFVGVARLGRPAANALARALSVKVEDEGVIDDYFERALDHVCDAHELATVDVSDLPCVEIDFPEDLDHARKQVGPGLLRPGSGT
jgi:choline kinase